jgi:hypothetical protein
MQIRNSIWTRGKYGVTAIVLGALLSSVPLAGQHFVTEQFDKHVKAGKQSPDSVFLIKTNYPTTGIVAKIDVIDEFTGAFILVDKDTFYIAADSDNDQTEASLFSNLLTFSPPIQEFRFSPGTISSPITFYFINSQTSEQVTQPAETKKKSADCSEPEMIDQTLWREGLPDPDYERIPNAVHNLIIHHSAGSNNDTDYVNVVRNIYIYHTEIRGWSDIGYNYLVAQDGTLFKGRDPGTLEQDAVLGAHFCGSNTGTLGICVLGSYSERAPPLTAIQSLKDLITWKMGKDSIDPEGMFPHPLNPNLRTMAGHRDGCATECPGDSLYLGLETLRQEIRIAFENCGYSIKPVTLQTAIPADFRVQYSYGSISITSGELSIDDVEVADMAGRVLDGRFMQVSGNSIHLFTENMKPGIYVLLIKAGMKTTSLRIQVCQ